MALHDFRNAAGEFGIAAVPEGLQVLIRQASRKKPGGSSIAERFSDRRHHREHLTS